MSARNVAELDESEVLSKMDTMTSSGPASYLASRQIVAWKDKGVLEGDHDALASLYTSIKAIALFVGTLAWISTIHTLSGLLPGGRSWGCRPNPWGRHSPRRRRISYRCRSPKFCRSPCVTITRYVLEAHGVAATHDVVVAHGVAAMRRRSPCRRRNP